MSPLVLHFVSGDAFFSGSALVAIAIVLSMRLTARWSRTIVLLLAATGSLFVIASAVPLPTSFYALWSVTIILWVVVVTSHWAVRAKLRIALGAIALAVSLTAVVAELPSRIMPTLPADRFDVLYVIGDSISAGVGGRTQQTWPRILRDQRGVNVIDLSQSGATTASAVTQSLRISENNAVIVVEIGGNDLLKPTAVQNFESDLDQVLARASQAGNAVLMFELPLFPFQNAYGRIQRRLAAKHGVGLIPRCQFAKIIHRPDATLDGLHLSQRGHELMAELVWGIAGNAIQQEALQN